MSTEYHQLPSQQGFMPQDLLTETDPWLLAATSNLSLSDAWAPPKAKMPILRSPLMFEHTGHDAAIENGWKSVTSPEMTPVSPMRMKSPIVGMVSSSVPREFYSSTSKIDAWSMQSPSPLIDSKRRTPQMGLKTSSSLQIPQSLSLSQGLTPEELAEVKAIEDELAVQNRYKTELCKSYTETGVCRYGAKCQFAHGKEEVRPILRHPKYKTETCKTFHSTGTCPYGIRCRFIHTRANIENPLAFSQDDELLTMSGGLTPPPGIPVPQWSKSWSPSSNMPQKRFGNKKHGLGKITLVEAVPDY